MISTIGTGRDPLLCRETVLALDLEKKGGVKGRLRSGKECPGREEPVRLNLYFLVQLQPGHVPRVRGGAAGLGTRMLSSHHKKQTRT